MPTLLSLVVSCEWRWASNSIFLLTQLVLVGVRVVVCRTFTQLGWLCSFRPSAPLSAHFRLEHKHQASPMAMVVFTNNTTTRPLDFAWQWLFMWWVSGGSHRKRNRDEKPTTVTNNSEPSGIIVAAVDTYTSPILATARPNGCGGGTSPSLVQIDLVAACPSFSRMGAHCWPRSMMFRNKGRCLIHI